MEVKENTQTPWPVACNMQKILAADVTTGIFSLKFKFKVKCLFKKLIVSQAVRGKFQVGYIIAATPWLTYTPQTYTHYISTEIKNPGVASGEE